MEKTKIIVGLGSCGIAAGAKKVFDKIENLKTDQSLEFDLEKTSCIGMCYREPLVEVIDGTGRYMYGDIDEEKATEIIENHILKHNPIKDYVVNSDQFKTVDNTFIDDQVKITLRNCGYIDPENIDDYESRDGYRAIKKIASQQVSRLDVIQTIIDSGLRGRGGGGFPTGLKWKFANNNKSDEKYIICNADEGDPGAFMDRSVLEGDPHAVIEGMIIGAYAIEATGGVIYCRAEYPLAIKRLEIALDQARAKGYLGTNILGIHGFNFDVYIKEGAGAFVCGEETALINSIEGKRGMPIPRPPFPAVKGLFGKPTIINNVETLSCLPEIIPNGVEKFSSIGTEKSKGTKVFALSGKVQLTGLVEVPMGTTIREVIFDIAGGIPDNKKFKSVQIGGPSGGCITQENLDIEVDYDSLIGIGAMMGSGGLVVMDEDTCMVDVAKFFMDFIQRESCGKCIPCREGTRRMLEILESITHKPVNSSENEPLERFKGVTQLEKLGKVIKETSLCGLGQTAPNPVLSTLKWFREEYEEHIFDRKCRASVCTELRTFSIDVDSCTGCTICAKKCPTDAIIGSRKAPHFIVDDKCIGCGTCYDVCKFESIQIS